MQRNMTWLLLLGMVASVVLTASDADAAWRRRAWRRNYGGNCCHTASHSCCDAGSNQHYGQPYEQDQGGPLEAPPGAPQEPQGAQPGAPPAPSAL